MGNYQNTRHHKAVVRAVDIVKPWPARSLQFIPGGRGIVIDDFVANLYSLAINWLLVSFVFGWKCRAVLPSGS